MLAHILTTPLNSIHDGFNEPELQLNTPNG
jgi:hypothetical protein